MTKKEILQEVWELMPDDITTRDLFYSTQIEPHIIKAINETREETIREVLNIELAPDTETIKTMDDFRTKYEAFGYGQGWVMRKVEELKKLKK